MRAALLLGLILLAVALPSQATTAQDLDLTVQGEVAHGKIALPAGPCIGVAVIARGYGHDAADHVAHLERLAGLGLVAVAMDYRGDTVPPSLFPLRAGALDTEAATRHAMDLCPGKPVHLYSVSVGTTVAGQALADMPGVFDDWVDNEGLSQLAETWAEASALAPANAFAKTASEAIAAECGGTPATQPRCYHDRSAVQRAPEFVGLKGVVLTHAINDGLVPYDQGREMQQALRAAGVPTDFITVVRDTHGGAGTTITGYASHALDNGFSGHGSEGDDHDTLTGLSFDLFYEVPTGQLVPSGQERVVESDLPLEP